MSGIHDAGDILMKTFSSTLSESMLSAFIKLFDRVYQLFSHEDKEYLHKLMLKNFLGESQLNFFKVSCGLLLRPGHYLLGLHNQLETL
jgi:hypothetical protein